MADALLAKLSQQYDILSERYIELESAFSEAKSALAIILSKPRSNTSSISTMSAATLITPCQSVGSSFLKTPREAKSMLRLGNNDVSSHQHALKRAQQELHIESQKRRVAENEVYRLRHLLNKAKSTQDSNVTRAKLLATPRDTVPREAENCLTSRGGISGISFTFILEHQLDSLRSSIAQLGLNDDDRFDLSQRIDKIAEVALLTRREAKSPPVTARRQRQIIPN